MVDDLLNDRENSRRNMFEEAAGISKFKIRKKETHKKLEDTSKDLERVEDLLFEINKNLRSLEKQAKQAEQYLKLKEEYKTASINLSYFSVHKQFLAQEKLQENIQVLQTNRVEAVAQIAKLDADIEAEKKKLLDKERLVGQRQKTINSHLDKIRTYESEKQIKNERLRFLTDRFNYLTRALEQDAKFIEQNKNRVSELQAQIELLQSDLIEKRDLTVAAKTATEVIRTEQTSLQSDFNKLSQVLMNAQYQLNQQERGQEIARMQLQTLRADLDKNQHDSGSQQSNLQNFKAKSESLLIAKEKLTQDLATYLTQEAEHKQKLEANRTESEKLKDQINKLGREIDVKQKEYDITKSLVDNLEGYPEAIRFLKKNNDWKHQAILLSDLLTCPEEYRVPIETYLEQYMNYYVVETAAQAIEAINLLGKSSKGRANFFVLDLVNPLEVWEKKEVPFSVAAMDLVEVDIRYRPLIQQLLGDVYITQQNLLPEMKDVTLLAKSGSIHRKSYKFSGGSVGIFEGKRIGRAKNLEKLQAEIIQLNKDLSTWKHEFQMLNAVGDILKAENKTAIIEQTRKALNKTEQDLVSVQVQGEQIGKFLESASTRKEDIVKRIDSLAVELNEKDPLIEESKGQVLAMEQQLLGFQEALKEANTTLQKANENFNALNTAQLKAENETEQRKQDLNYKQQELAGLEKRIARNTEEEQQVSSEIAEMGSATTVNDSDLLAMYAEKEEIAKGVTEAEKDYYATRAAIDALDKDSKEFQRKREGIDEQLQLANNSINEIKLGLTAVTERLSVEFNVQLNQREMAHYEPSERSEQELRAEVDGLKVKLDRLGPINPMAMEAYQEMSERFTFITTQKKDLLDARTSLMATISEIDTVAKTNFMDCFTKVRENFQRVFRSLFTEEDTCDLILTDPSNPLESSIDIIAKPKGKRPLTINQLSGGEKTLTAISLLFSIYLIKPAPFCIFDEVDAPLDDANIDKFNNIIRTFSKESQFIIVTHNKRTMSSTDVIYGVTMQEAGVSKLIPVDLREYEVG
jgi:chromosome segregation protein